MEESPPPAPEPQPKKGAPLTSWGQAVSFAVALGACAVWLKTRPGGAGGGAGGAVFPVLVVIALLYFSTAWLGPVLDERVFDRANARKLKARRLGRPFLSEVDRQLDKHRVALGVDKVALVEAALEALDNALDGEDAAAMEAALERAETVVAEQMSLHRKGIIRDFTESIGGALLIALVLRTFVVEAFKIPSGSMIPTLAIGDHIFVNKFAYGAMVPFSNPPQKILQWQDPAPGDVIVFIAPEPADNAGEDFIKRVVAVAGQKIELRKGVLSVDGKEYPRVGGEEMEYREVSEFSPIWMDRRAQHYVEDVAGVKHSVLYERHGLHDWPTYAAQLGGLDCDSQACTVKPGYVFCMGDNRDNSADSRKWGAVPLENVKGKALVVWLSVDSSDRTTGTPFPRIRWDRLGQVIR